MILFWTLAALMLVVGVSAMTPVFLRRDAAVASLAEDRSENVVIARERLAELEAERAAGAIDDETFAQARDELEKGLLDDLAPVDGEAAVVPATGGRSGLVFIALLVPLLTIALYLAIGSPQLAGGGAALDEPHAGVSDKPAPSMEEMVAMLKQRISEQPEDAEAWFMLGRLQAARNDFTAAVVAYEKVAELTENHPNALVVLADAVAMTQDGKVAGRPYELVMQVLQAEPDNVTALWLAGKGAMESADYPASLDYYRRAEAQLGDSPEMQAEVAQQIAMLRQVAADAGVELPAAVDPPVSDVGGIEITVDLAPALAGQVAADAVLFVFARAVDGPPMPLAAVRQPAEGFPLRLTLDDSSLLQSGSSLADFPALSLTARIANSGQPIASSGDLQSDALTVAPAAGATASLTIDRVVP